MSSLLPLIVTAPHNLEDLLMAEVTGLGAHDAVPGGGEVRCRASAAVAARICLWSRLGSRLLLPLAVARIDDADGLYEACRGIDWGDWLGPTDTFAVDVTGAAASGPLPDPRYAALRVKDAVVDTLRARRGHRPNVDRLRPSVRLHVRVAGATASLAVDLGNGGLHRRGYRDAAARAPLRENLAAAILWRAGFDGHQAVVDPMCGSGTLLIEAALWAADLAPGRHRPAPRLGDDRLWAALLAEADERAAAGRRRLPPLCGADSDDVALAGAAACAARAGVGDCVRWRHGDVEAARPPAEASSGHVVVNPPYGARMGHDVDLAALYGRLGATLRAHFAGWEAHVLVADPALGHALGLRAERRHVLHNGPLRCHLLHLPLRPPAPGPAAVPRAQPLRDRLRKNLRRLGPWLRREKIECFRLYDADIPEFNVAIDVYGAQVQLAEYSAPANIPSQRTAARLRDARQAAAEALQVAPSAIRIKQRRRQGRLGQYGPHDDVRRDDFFVVAEGRCRFWVNLDAYLDTGLFLEQRGLRAHIAAQAAGRHVLNLFGYTAAATVAAALGGAVASTTVDLSPTYLRWAAENLALNGVSAGAHRLVRADVLTWLAGPPEALYDLVVVDPPTFSNSKRMPTALDVQRDHVGLVRRIRQHMAPGGTILFSTHGRHFTLDEAALAADGLRCTSLTPALLPPDFRGNPRILRVWQLQAA